MRWTFAALLATLLLSPAALWSQRTLTLTGAPFQPDPEGYGAVTLIWSVPAASLTTVTEIRVGSPNGELFSSGGPTGAAQTGQWVKEGTRFFLLDMSFGPPGIPLASLTIHASTPSSNSVHYVAAASTTTNLSPALEPPRSLEPPGAVMLFDRDTTDLLWTAYFSGEAKPFATSRYGETLYVSVAGKNPGVAAVDARTASVQAFISLPGEPIFAVRAEGPGGVTRLLVSMHNAASDVAVIDPLTNSISSWVPCPGQVSQLAYNRFNRNTYASMRNRDDLQPRQDLCVIGPDFLAGPSLQTQLPAGRTPENIVVLDNGEAGALLISSSPGEPYFNYVTDLRESGTDSSLVSALNGVYAALADPKGTRSLYGLMPDGNLQRDEWSFAADRTPLFEAHARTSLSMQPLPSIADDRYLYLPVSGSCNIVEGPVQGCSVGFRMVDALTLEPRADNDSVVFAYPWLDTLLINRMISLTVAGEFRSGDHAPGPLPLRCPATHLAPGQEPHPGGVRNRNQ